MQLSQQRCVPCEGGALPLTLQEEQRYLREVKGWTLKNSAITKKFTLRGFSQAVEFVNHVAKIAQQEGHHPDIFVSYNNVTLTLSTHAIGGLSPNDFIVAAKIDEIK